MKAASSLKTFLLKFEPKKYIQNIVSSKKQTLWKFNLASALIEAKVS